MRLCLWVEGDFLKAIRGFVVASKDPANIVTVCMQA